MTRRADSASNTGSRDPDALRRRAGIIGDPARDQHFLVDDRVLDRLPGYLPADANGHVLEIGAGTGGLTDRLLQHADHVVAIERDRNLAAFLREEFAQMIEAGRLDVLTGDALEIELPSFTGSVSNLPYGASSQIAFRLLPRARPLVLMFQLEFAERMVADPGTDAYGRLSVTAQHYADIEIVETVPASAFDPAPEVDSAVVRTTPRTPEYTVPDETFFLNFVKAVFTQRRKTLRNAIRNTTHISGLSNPEALIDDLDESVLARRPGTIDPATFAAIASTGFDLEGGGES